MPQVRARLRYRAHERAVPRFGKLIDQFADIVARHIELRRHQQAGAAIGRPPCRIPERGELRVLVARMAVVLKEREGQFGHGRRSVNRVR